MLLLSSFILFIISLNNGASLKRVYLLTVVWKNECLVVLPVAKRLKSAQKVKKFVKGQKFCIVALISKNIILIVSSAMLVERNHCKVFSLIRESE